MYMTSTEDILLEKLVRVEFALERAEREIEKLQTKIDTYERAKIEMLKKVHGLTDLLVYNHEKYNEEEE